MENCCRTCLSEKQPNEMKFLSTKWNNTSLSFANMLIDLVTINKEITSDDASLKICPPCELDLITSYKFKTLCQNTEKILSERLTEIIKLPFIEEIKCETIIEEISTHENDRNNFSSDDDTKVIELKHKSVKKRKSKLSPPKKIINKSIKKIINKDTKKIDQTKNKRKPESTTNECKIVEKKPRSRRNRKPCTRCKKCDLTFEAEKFYRKHCEDTHWQSYPCNICGKLFLQNRIKRHILTHTTERNFICSVCDAKFTTDTNLKDHFRIHTGEKRYKCHYCDEKFIHSNSRKNHMYKIHTKEKKYECYLCHRLFAQRGQMVLHIKYHIGDLPHVCSFGVCDKRFPHAYALKIHELTHLRSRKKRVCVKRTASENTDETKSQS